ncbi:MAG: DoxX family protein [Patescibacteria group bacterium]
MINIKKNHDLGMFLLRLAVGVIFVAHGWSKFANMEQTIGFFGQLGMPSVFAYLVAAIELLGGLALVIGLYTDLAALLLAIVMVVAIVYVKMATLKVGLMGGYEFDIVLLASNLAIMFVGPGKYAGAKKKA